MKTSAKGIELIKSFEGFRSKAYKAVSSERYYTIGYGHYGKDVAKDAEISMEQATVLLAKDLEKFEGYVNEINKKGNYDFKQNEFDALVSFTYNCGKGNLVQLTNNGKRSQLVISNKILLYNKAGGKVLRGLEKRRKKEQAVFLLGEY